MCNLVKIKFYTMRYLKSITLTICLIIASVLMAQNFQGTIEFTKKNQFDETNYVYYVSSSMVRIDELEKDGSITGTMLVNLRTKKVTAINHDRKLHMNVKTKPSVKDLSNCETFKTNEKKNILGYDCVKWTVNNPEFKSKAEFWVIEKGDYLFFKDLLTALNRKDKEALYFMQIPENTGYFPIIGQETSYDGKLKSRLETTKMTKRKIDPITFKIPTGYKEFKN